jgi:L-threonylcarbamoyladenylate synthase
MRISPGMYPRHYAPRATVILAKEPLIDQPGLTFHDPIMSFQRKMPMNPVAYAASFYNAMYELDKIGVDEIYVELPPEGPEWEAIHDRLRKASHREE